MDNDTYFTISNNKVGQGTYSEKRSKFLAFAHHVETEDEAKALVATYRKQYFDARHVCYAYSVGHDSPTIRMNDDGEPSSTGGKPIYGQILKASLTNVIVIVVRYYGGVNLGTGPLAVAYKTAAAMAIAESEIEECTIEEIINICFPYEQMNNVMRIVKEIQPRILHQSFDNTCILKLSIRRTMGEILKSKLNPFVTFLA